MYDISSWKCNALCQSLLAFSIVKIYDRLSDSAIAWKLGIVVTPLETVNTMTQVSTATGHLLPKNPDHPIEFLCSMSLDPANHFMKPSSTRFREC